MAFDEAEGTFFWSNGDAWGTCAIGAGGHSAELKVLHGGLTLRSFRLGASAPKAFKAPRVLKAGESVRIEI
jgi:hypothetical protein